MSLPALWSVCVHLFVFGLISHFQLHQPVQWTTWTWTWTLCHLVTISTLFDSVSDRDTKSGSEIENFYENLILSPQPPGLKMSKICQVQLGKEHFGTTW